MKVFLDTNVLVAAFTSRGLCADVARVALADHILLTGEVNLRELRRVLRQRIRVPAEQVDRVVALLRAQTVVRKPRQAPDVSVRDPDDLWVLASAVAGGADVLVTCDHDLLEVADSPVRILTPRQFWELVRTPDSE
jgi:putative PIN family toxin of toxin-antitoxin system